MSMSAFSKTIVRSIRDSLGRFLAIVGIVALGCGFFAGLQMSGPDMRSEADAYYADTNLYDLKLVSTLGFSDKDMTRVGRIDGLGSTAPSISCDAVVSMGSDQLATRISTLDTAENRDGIGRLLVCEGRLPRTPTECVLGMDEASAAIGDTVKVLYGLDNLDDLLRERTFEVVGTVRSSQYPYSGNYGSTALGSGLIEQYMYVVPAAFKDDAPFTEIYTSVTDARAHRNGTDAYKDSVDVASNRIEDQQEELADARLGDLRAEAQDELDKNRATYNKERADALKELDSAQDELDQAKKDLDDAQAQLEDGEREYEDGLNTLHDSRAEAEERLGEAQATIDDSRAEIDERTDELADARAQFEEGANAHEEGVRQILSQTGTTTLVEAKAMLEEGHAQADQGIQSLTPTIEGVQGLIDQSEALESGQEELLGALASMGMEAQTAADAATELETTIASLEEVGAPEEQIAPMREALTNATQIAGGLEQIGQARSELLGSLAKQGIEATDEADALVKLQSQLDEARDALSQTQEGLDGIARLEEASVELDDAEAQLEDGESQLADGRDQLEEGQAELDREAQNAYDELANGESQLEDAREQLESGRDELASGRRTYESSYGDYKKARAEAHEKLADGQKKLDDAQAEIDDLEAPDVYVLDRMMNEGVSSYDSDSKRIDAIANVFPLMFFLVAALVALTTMTRMVEDDRIELGTYKALGYSTARIASKYLVYAGMAGGLGALIGIAALTQLLPFIIVNSYSTVYDIPVRGLPFAIDPLVVFGSGGLGVGVTLLATWAAVVSSLRETPANLMLPRAPVAGKRILLERVAPIWTRLSFSWKVTCRNLFRYKRRLAMTVVGISGCTALMLVGFGLHDSIWDIVACQFGQIDHYDAVVTLDEDTSEHDLGEVLALLKERADAQAIVRVAQKNMRVGLQDGDTSYVQVIVPHDCKELPDAITLRDRVSHKDIGLEANGVVVTEKVATTYGLSVGDTMWVYDLDTTGNAKGEGKPVQITGVTENYVGSTVYMGDAAWQGLKIDENDDKSDGDLDFRTLYVTTGQGGFGYDFVKELRDRKEVSTAVITDETMELYNTSLTVVDMCVIVLIVSAGALAFVVLYNLTNINVAERVREIASLKVLGFTRREVYSYIFREMILLSILGDVLGLAFGTWLEGFVVVTAETDYLMFGRAIHAPSYAYAFVLTLVFCVLIMFGMRGKLDRVNMVESLKSVD